MATSGRLKFGWSGNKKGSEGCTEMGEAFVIDDIGPFLAFGHITHAVATIPIIGTIIKNQLENCEFK